MQPFFETSGWALPKSIAPQKQKESTKKTKSAQVEDNSKEGKASREADQIQAQMATLNDESATPKEPKAKKPRNRNKKRSLEQNPEEKESVQNKKAKTAPSNDQKKKLQQVIKLIYAVSFDMSLNIWGNTALKKEEQEYRSKRQSACKERKGRLLPWTTRP